MKKSLLISALAFMAIGVKAQTAYDFNTTPAFFSILQNPEELWYTTGNFDLADKTGKCINFDNEEFTSALAIDLEEGEVVNAAEVNQNHVFLGCTGSPSRVIWMQGWGDASLEEYQNNVSSGAKMDYKAASEADFVATKHALGLLRNASTGSRVNTFVQFPQVQAPCKVSVWAGHGGGSYVAGGLKFLLTPVVDGVVGEPVAFQKEEVTAKRMYRIDYDYTGEGPVSFRVGNNGNEMHIYHVMFTPAGASAIDRVNADAEDNNAPTYNLLGVTVGDDYKGIVIRNGKKYIRK